jgi:copper chaperone CopZ
MDKVQTIEVPIAGMDCAECTRHVQTAIAQLPGVDSVDVFLASEKAVIRLDPARVQLPAIREAVKSAGYAVPESAAPPPDAPLDNFTRWIVTLLAVLFGVILFIIVVGEWLGLFEQLTGRVPFVVGLALVVAAGLPIFRNVVRAALKRAGIQDRDIQTGSISLNPEYNYQQNQPPKLTGYQASNQLSVRFRDIGETGKILDALVSEGANQINGPSLTIDKPEAALDEARVKAIANGRARADLYARALGMRVVRLLSVSESGGYAVPPPMPMAVMAMERDSASTKIDAGEQKLQVSVSLSFELQ